MWIVSCCIFLFLGFSGLVLQAQHIGRNTPVFEHITTQHGLPQNNIRSIVEDKQGFLWCSSKNGLCRFDGYKFVYFQHLGNSPYVVSDNTISALALDSSGYIWAGTFSSGLNRIDPTTGGTTQYSHQNNNPKSLADNKVTTVVCSPDGVLWVGSWSTLSRFEPSTATFINYALPKASSANHVVSIFADARGVIWVATEVAVYHFDSRSEQWSVWRPLHTVHAFCEDSQGRLWMGGTFGAERYNPRTALSTSFRIPVKANNARASLVVITDIAADNQDNIWVGTMEDGLLRYYSATATWEQFVYNPANKSGLSHNAIRNILCDSKGILWVTTRGGGINKCYLRAETFRQYEFRNREKTIDLVTNVLCDTNGSILIGTRLGIETLYKQCIKPFAELNQSAAVQVLQQMKVLGLNFDRRHRLCVATRNGAYILSNSAGKSENIALFFDVKNSKQTLPSANANIAKTFTQRFKRYLAAVPTVQMSAVLQDRYGDYWFGSRGGGVYRVDSTLSDVRVYRHDSSSVEGAIDIINVLIEDSNGVIWAGSQGGLLTFDRKEQRFVLYRHDPHNTNSISSNNVQCIYEDYSGTVWVGTDNGLNVFHPTNGRWQHFFVTDGLSNNSINGIVGESSSDVLWVSTEFGLTKIDVHKRYDNRHQSLQNVPLVSCSFTTFGVHNGLPQAEFIPKACCRGNDGLLYFGQNNGILSVDPTALQYNKNTLAPPIVLTALKTLGKPYSNNISYPSQTRFEIEEKQNVITFEFVAVNYYYTALVPNSFLCFPEPLK